MDTEFTNTFEDEVVGFFFQGATTSQPSGHEVALFLQETASDLEADSANEVSASKYDRQNVSFSDTNTIGKIEATDITFPKAESNWGTIKAIGVYATYSDGTGDTLLAYDNDVTHKDITSGNQYRIETLTIQTF